MQIGRIDLTTNCSFFEVPEGEADYVMKKMGKARVGDRQVVVDLADREPGKGASAGRGPRRAAERKADRPAWKERKGGRRGGRYEEAEQWEKSSKDQEDWRQFFKKN